MGTTTDEADTTTLDTLLRVLSDPARRRILSKIREHDPRNRVEFTPEEFITPDDYRGHLRVELYHVHLPKLASEEFIDWNQETETITPGPNFEDIRPVLTLLEEHQEKLPGTWTTLPD